MPGRDTAGDRQNSHLPSVFQAGGFWSRLKGLFGISRAASKKSEAQTLQEKESSDENELLDQM